MLDLLGVYMAKETYYMAKETYLVAKETYYMAYAHAGPVRCVFACVCRGGGGESCRAIAYAHACDV